MQDILKGASRRVTVARISVPRPYHVLAEHLRDSILRGEIAEGDALPSERELVSQTGLTRGAVREALRTLAVEGLVQTRHGRFGGSVVTLPGPESMAKAIGRFVQGRRLPLRTLQETREGLEPFLARLAAERRSADDLVELRVLHARLEQAIDDFNGFAALNVQWHATVARASGNELLSALLYSLAYGVQVATLSEEYDTRETRRQVLAVHARIIEAIADRDTELAERAMRQHILAAHARPLAIAHQSIPLARERPRPAQERTALRRAAARR